MTVETYEVVRAPYWAKKEYYFRKKPDNSSNSPGRIKNRLKFSEAAHNSYGQEGLIDGVPVVAANVQAVMTGPDVEDVVVVVDDDLISGLEEIIKIKRREEKPPDSIG